MMVGSSVSTGGYWWMGKDSFGGSKQNQPQVQQLEQQKVGSIPYVGQAAERGVIHLGEPECPSDHQCVSQSNCPRNRKKISSNPYGGAIQERVADVIPCSGGVCC